jgi:soluble lytic murein transglycosylase-like protein
MKRLVLTLLVVLTAPGVARAQDLLQPHIAVAATRFDLPVRLIEEVIAAESDGKVGAVSPAGAMGLMQLMPGTWAALRARLALGADPFDPADNILAGAAYLRELRDRYGAPGFLAAYNAGPGRYEASLAGRPLPLETRAYVARLVARAGVASASPVAWQSSEVFAQTWPTDLGGGALETPLAAGGERLFAPRRDSGR